MESNTVLFIIAIISSFGIAAFGSKTAVGLDRSRRRRHVRTFSFLALMPICIVFLVTLPIVIDYTSAEDIAPISQVELNTPENVAQTVSSQTRHISAMERDIKRLSEDLKEVNDYYRRLVYGLLGSFLMVGLALLISEFGEPEKGEIKANPLDLEDV